MRKAKLLENASEAHLGQINAKAFAKNPLEIHAAPARNPILLRIGASFHETPQFLFLLQRKLRWAARGCGVDQAFSALVIETMHPIAQRLAIHAADARRLFAVHSVVNRSQGQEATRLVGVLRRSRQTAQPVRLKILPKTNSGAHSQPPESKCSGTNESHRSTRKQESYSLKAGIRIVIPGRASSREPRIQSAVVAAKPSGFRVHR